MKTKKWLAYYNKDEEEAMGSDVYRTLDDQRVIATDVLEETEAPPKREGAVCVGAVNPVPIERHRFAACGNDLNKYF